MRKIRLSVGARDIYGKRLNTDDYKPVYSVKGETPMTVIIVVQGEKRVFSKTDLVYSE